MSPEATILVKKKVFSSMKSCNDIRYMDKTEKMLLRATKALFAYKVQQIRAYESLTKFENFFTENGMYSMNLLSSFMKEASMLNLEKLSYTVDEYIAKRLKDWYSEKRFVKTDEGYSVYDASTKRFISLTEQQIESLVNSQHDIDEDGIPEIDLGELPGGGNAYSEIPILTNRQYLKTLPASQAKGIVDRKKESFRKEYEGKDGVKAALDAQQGALEVALDTPGTGFWDDLATLVSASGAAATYDAMNEDIVRILRRNAFSSDNQLTTWIVDPDSPENYTLGPGTGVIEVAIFNNFSTTTDYKSSPSSASFSLTYPYRLGTILEDDIEAAIEEALYGTIGVLGELMNGGMQTEGLSGRMPQIDGSSIASAAFELSGLSDKLGDSSLDTDYIRDRLRTFYLGKSFINPPDPVHFYIRGNRTFRDYTAVGSSYAEDASEAPFDEGYMQIDETILKAEYQLYTAQGITYEQYKGLRKRQDNSFGMIHVFGGFVNSVSESFNGGFWDMKVSCTDNMSWLSWSQFAIAPSLSDPKNILEDPLTPFTLVKDELGQIVPSERDLLYENKQLLQSGLMSYDSGLFAGQNALEGNLLQGQYNGVGSLKGKKVMQHPDGFVYRWKTGIITATAGFQSIDPTGSNQSASTQHSQAYAVTVAKDVLNNLDVPNILSILIVGQPYNLETFIEQSFSAHNKSDKSSRLNPQDPLTGVVEAVRKQNEYFGNFHPYRMLSVSSASAEQMINTAGIRQTANNSVKKLQQRKIAIRKKMRALKKSGSVSTGIPVNALLATLEAEIGTIDAAIERQIEVGTMATNALNSADQVGIQISLNGPNVNLPVSGDEDENNDITRAMMLVGAQRRIEDVRLNRDRNLLIVSDQYDMADIRPFILSLNGGKWNLFNSQYTNVFQTCSTATDILNLEFFCNSQGHLEFRPPQWNKTPLSVLREVIRTQEETGRSIMPSFITNLFQTRIDSLRLEVHTLNVTIVLLALMMGRFPDRTLIPNMKLTGAASLKFFSVGSKADAQMSTLHLRDREKPWVDVGSMTEQNNSLFGEGLKITASYSESGDILAGDTETLLGEFDPIFQEESGVINDVLTAFASGASGGSSVSTPAAGYADMGNLNYIRDSFKKQFGRDPAKSIGIDLSKGFINDDILSNTTSGTDIEKALIGEQGLLAKLKKAISKRDSFVSMLQANLAKQEELNEIETFLTTGEEEDFETGIDDPFVDFLENSATSIQTGIDIITGKVAEGTVYDHLISDDSRNLLGYGSGKRFLLKDEYIMSITFSENPPEFTRVDIEGDAPFVGGDINSGTDGMYFWAGATDFDLWRQYGYRGTKKSLPFISDVEGQARPYAILELGLQKMSVNKANATIAGNEFYQPGDTVYIPSKGLLYYIESVNHSFSYGQSFTTSLTLTYGHPPGDYVPGPLDVIGQELVGNFMEDPAIIQRTVDSDDNYRVLKPDSTLVFPTGGASMAELLSFSDNQVRFTNMMVDVMGAMSGSKYLMLRGFVKDEADSEEIENVRQKLAVVRLLFENPSQIAQNHQYSGGDDIIEGFAQAATQVGSMFGGGSVGTTNSLKPMRLPNNLPVTPIPAAKIIEQLSYLRRGEDTKTPATGEIKCLDRKLLGAFYLDSQTVDQNKAAGIFPKGGPRQGSWLDFRDELVGFNFGSQDKPMSVNVIEVGIIDIPNSILSTKL